VDRVIQTLTLSIIVSAIITIEVMQQMLMDNKIVNVKELKLMRREQTKKKISCLLNEYEMNEIKGNGAVVNKNTFDGCSCLYNDHRNVSNENTVAGCSCYCTNPNY